MHSGFRLWFFCSRGAPIALLAMLIISPLAGGEEQLPWSLSPSTEMFSSLNPGHCPRVADPKLTNGDIPISYRLRPGATYRVSVLVTQGSWLVRTIFDGNQTGSNTPLALSWDGRDQSGQYLDPGDYTVRIRALKNRTSYTLEYPLSIVRLGITEIEAQENNSGEEWQMVYFRKGSQYDYYATPAIHEYINVARTGEISDLDLDDCSPRPAASVHTATDSPVLNGSNYETQSYNYPLCYLNGSQPRFEVTMGSDCTSREGNSISCGYPLSGVRIRGLALDLTGSWSSSATDIAPGSSYLYLGSALPSTLGRTARSITWSWQYQMSGEKVWHEIPGHFQTSHRFYTIANEPYWASGASGTQYSGPWVEVADYFHSFSQGLGMTATDETDTVTVFVRGYFGQEGSLSTAIEGVIYDTYTMGGDGGASHYYSWSSDRIYLAQLLNDHDYGVYVNCSDVASSGTVMLGMLGVQNIRMLYLYSMSLRAIWGVGCPGYTLDLWGGSHGFSYHHIMTRDSAVTVSDACMWLDEDGNPDALPGTPGYNCDRPWSGSNGYNALSATNNVSYSLDLLPEIQ